MAMSSNKNAAIFLDRDGTIIDDTGYLKEPSDMVFFPETFEALRSLQNQFLLFIVTHQPGVARGMITLDDTMRVNAGLTATLAEAGIEITDVFVCPHIRSDDCECIKPKAYFLEKAAENYGIDLSKSFTIGDHPHDIQLAKNVGAQGIYVLTGHGQKHLDELPEDTKIVPGVMEAAETIILYRLEATVSRSEIT